MFVIRSLVIAAALLGGLVQAALAQDAPPVDQIIADNIRLGSDCNEIAYALVFPRPATPGPDYNSDHATCHADLIATATCTGVTDGKRQAEGCMIKFFNGDAVGLIDCDDITLVTNHGEHAPDPVMSDGSTAYLRNRPSEYPGLGNLHSCTEPTAVKDGASINANFLFDQPADERALRVQIAPDLTFVFIDEQPVKYVEKLPF